ASDISRDLQELIAQELTNEVCADPLKSYRPHNTGLDKVLPIQAKGMENPTPYQKGLSTRFKNKVVKASGPMRQRLVQLLMSEDRVGWARGLKRGSPDPKALHKLATGTSDRVLR